MSDQFNQLPDKGQLPAVAGRHQLSVYNPYVLPDQESEDLNLRRIWHIIKRYRWLIVSVAAVSVITTLIFTLMMRPVYRATALVELKPNPAVMSFEAAGRNSRDAEAFRNTQMNIMLSEAVTLRVISEMNLDKDPEFSGEIKQRGVATLMDAAKRKLVKLAAMMPSSLSPSDAATPESLDAASTGSDRIVAPEARKERAILNRYMGRLDVARVEASDLVRVSVESFDPHMAADLANAHTREYIRFVDQRRFNSTSSAKKYLREQIEKAEANLEASEHALTDFAREHNIVDVEDRGNVMQKRFEDLSRALTEKRQEYIMTEIAYKQAQEGDLESFPAVLDNNFLNNLRQQYAALRAEYQEMGRTFKDTYPRMQQLKARMDEVRATLREESETLVQGLRKRYEQLGDQERELTVQLEDQRTKLLDLKERAITYNILKREWEANRELYTGLLERQKDFSVASGMEFNDASIVDEAVTPTSKHKPDNVKNVTVAGVFGVMGGIGIAFLLAFLDNTFKTREDLEQTLGIPFMGIVPRIGRVTKDRLVPTALISAYQPENSIAEAVRSIRTGMLFSRPDHVPKTILISSTTGGEGKSTISMNLALILAQSGGRVLIVDTDLRKPVIGKWLDLEEEEGLAEYLNGKDVDIVKATSFENLYAVPAGGKCARPTDLLASVRMRDYLDAMSQRFDFILIDGPPCLGVADSMLLSAKVDGTLLIVKAGVTEKHVVAETVKRLRMVNAPLIGSILNCVDLQRPEYADYGKYYGYGDERVARAEQR